MIDVLHSYASYAPSAVPWADVLPAHWRVLRGKGLFAESKLPVRDEDEIVTCFRDGQVTLRRNRRTSGFMIALKEAGYQGVRHGQLVIHAMDAFAGAIGIADSDGKCTPEYIVCNPRHPDTVPAYFARALRLAAHSNFIQVSCPAVRERAPRLRYPNFGEMLLPVPPRDEQAAIVRFLEYADGRLRRYIAAKQKLIKLLEEQRRVIVQRAVTRGLNPSVALKPSGVPGLGHVPAHWRISRIKAEFKSLNSKRVPLSSSQRGLMTSRLYDYYGASGAIDKVDDYLFDGELLLIAEDGANLVLRNLPLAIIARGKFWVNNHAHILEPRRGNIEYLAAYLETLDYTPWITGAAQPKLTKDRLMSIQIAVPDAAEQDAIMSALADETSTLRSSIRIARQEVSLLREFAMRLVTDVVTGRLDVRAAAADLHAEVLDTEGSADADAGSVDVDIEVGDDAVDDDAA